MGARDYDSHRFDALVEDLLFLAHQGVTWEAALLRVAGDCSRLTSKRIEKDLGRKRRLDVMAAFNRAGD